MILLIYNEVIDNLSCNSILKMFRDLQIYRNDVIVYKVFIHVPSAIKKYKNDITEIIKKNNIKLIFCVWSYLKINKCIPQTINMINHLNNWNLGIKILYHTHDFFWCLKKYENLNNINNCIEIGFKDQIELFTNKNNKIYEILHCATNSFIKEFNKNPINKILLSGGIDIVQYPERKNFYDYSKKNINIIYKKHPGYFNQDNKYPDELNSYIACFYSSINVEELKNNRIILAKAFEIPATGSLLLAHESCKDSLTRVGFIENINCMFINEDNYDSVIDYILDEKNRSKIDEIRKNGQELVLKNHMENHRISEINKILDNIMNETN
jgi:hypothetical protein